VRAVGEVVGTELLVGDAVAKDVVSGDQDGVAGGTRGLGGSASALDPGVLSGQVRAPAPGRRLGRLGQTLAEPLGAGPALAGLALARGLVVAGAHAGPGGQVSGRGELGHVHPDLGDDHLGGPPVHPGNGVKPSTCAEKGAITSSIRVLKAATVSS